MPALLTVAALLGCGGGTARTGDAAGRPSARPASPTLSRPATPTTSAALARVPDGRAARTRLAYADTARLREADLPVPQATVVRAVLGPAAGRSPIAVGRRRAAFAPAAQPETSAITPAASAAVQSCLGDAMAQTIVGPARLGDDAAIGAGLAVSRDAPAGVQLRLCAAPHYVRHVHQAERDFERAFGDLRGTRVRGVELGEREIMTATVAARRIAPARLRAVLAGAGLTALARWR